MWRCGIGMNLNARRSCSPAQIFRRLGLAAVCLLWGAMLEKNVVDFLDQPLSLGSAPSKLAEVATDVVAKVQDAARHPASAANAAHYLAWLALDALARLGRWARALLDFVPHVDDEHRKLRFGRELMRCEEARRTRANYHNILHDFPYPKRRRTYKNLQKDNTS